MDISLITSQSLRSLLSLTEKKDELIKGLEEIHAEIARTLKGGAVSFIEVVTATKPAPVAPAKAARTAPKAKARRSGGLKARILALLDVAGSGGLRVKEIAEKLGVRPTNISVWFSTTGKKITSKIESGRYAAKGASASRSPAAAKLARHAAPEKTVKASKKSKMSAAGRARISAATKARWAAQRASHVTARADVAPKAPKPAKAKKKSGLSPEGRAKLAAAATARWAAVRAAKAAKPTASAKPAKALKKSKV